MVFSVNAVGAALAVAFVVWLAWTLTSLQREISRMKRSLRTMNERRPLEPPPDSLLREGDLPIREDQLDRIDFSAALADDSSEKKG